VQIDSLRPYVLLPADHRFAREERVSIAALTGEPTVVFDVPPSRANWERTVEALGIEPMVGHRTSNFELARCLVGRGLGYAVLYQLPSLDLTYENRRVVARPIEEEVPALGIVLGFLRGTVLSARGRRFADFAVAEMHAAPAGA
jgi:DNA-binding transcriptional LysR family regulator